CRGPGSEGEQADQYGGGKAGRRRLRESQVESFRVGSVKGLESLLDAAFPGQAPAQGGLGLNAGLVSVHLLGDCERLSTHLDRFVGLVLEVEASRKSRASDGKVAARAKRLQHLPGLPLPRAGL